MLEESYSYIIKYSGQDKNKRIYMVGIAQLVSAPDCGSGGQGFESLYPPW